jgi:hypothetical protein
MLISRVGEPCTFLRHLHSQRGPHLKRICKYPRMCCNFVVEPKVGVDDRHLVLRREQIENEVVQ